MNKKNVDGEYMRQFGKEPKFPINKFDLLLPTREFSSVGLEHHVDNVRVDGSNPLIPTLHNCKPYILNFERYASTTFYHTY